MTSPGAVQLTFDDYERGVARRALDELFTVARQYAESAAYFEFLRFVTRFRFYSPFNAMLIHTQMPGAQFVAPPMRWLRDYGRRIRPGAQPIVILKPKGPVMFVFDVCDTEPTEHAKPLPPEVTGPFEVRGGTVGRQLERTIENAKRDGIGVFERSAGSQSAGSIGTAEKGRYLTFQVKERPEPEHVQMPLRYELLLNANHSRESKYATLAHELGHLYCGHLGTPNDKWWPDRRGLTQEVEELEAESVCYLVCARQGIDNPSHEYLSSYVRNNKETASISLDYVMKATHLIEQMGQERLGLRKDKKE